MENIKNCTQCSCDKYLNEFYQKKNGYYRSECKICTLKKCKEYRDKNKKKVSTVIKKCRQNNHEMYLETEKRYRESNQDKIIKLRTENKGRYMISKRKYEHNKLLIDPEYKILKNIRRRINRIMEINSSDKLESSVKLLGCNSKFFKFWLEHQFDSNMSWENYGSYWHIDHVIPCSYFNILTLSEQQRCFNWKNCRPLRGEDNISKNNKIIPLQILLQEIRVYHYDMRQNQIAGNS